jgi:hypothetical protein
MYTNSFGGKNLREKRRKTRSSQYEKERKPDKNRMNVGVYLRVKHLWGGTKQRTLLAKTEKAVSGPLAVLVKLPKAYLAMKSSSFVRTTS